jgi:hypothetical protein
VRVRIAPGTRRPCSSPGRAASLYLAGSRFDPGRGLLMAGCSVGRGAMALNHERTLVRFQPGQLCLRSSSG